LNQVETISLPRRQPGNIAAGSGEPQGPHEFWQPMLPNLSLRLHPTFRAHKTGSIVSARREGRRLAWRLWYFTFYWRRVRCRGWFM